METPIQMTKRMFWVKSLEEECSKLKEQQIKSPRAKKNLRIFKELKDGCYK